MLIGYRFLEAIASLVVTFSLSHSVTHSLTHNLVKPFMISAFPFILHTIANCFIHSHYPFLSDPYQILFNQSFDTLFFPIQLFDIQILLSLYILLPFYFAIQSFPILSFQILYNTQLFLKSGPFKLIPL